jgi:O-antigen/teichoic acid export membrane protein
MMAGLVLNLGDRLVVLRYLGQAAVGRYQIAYNAAGIIILLLSVLNQAWEPTIYAAKDEGLRRSILARSRDQLFYLEVPLILGVALGAPIALRILAPPSFHPAGLVDVVALVAISAIPYAAYLANLRTLMAYRGVTSLVWAGPVCACANIGLNILLVPRLGIDGSALATLVCYGMLAATTRIVAQRYARLPGTPGHVYVALGITVVASFAITLVPASSIAELSLRLVGALACGVWATLFVARVVKDTKSSGHRAHARRHFRLLIAVFFGPPQAPATPTGSGGGTKADEPWIRAQ